MAEPDFSGQRLWLRADPNSGDVTIDFTCKNDRLPGFIAHIDRLIAATNARANERNELLAADDAKREREREEKARIQAHLDSL